WTEPQQGRTRSDELDLVEEREHAALAWDASAQVVSEADDDESRRGRQRLGDRGSVGGCEAGPPEVPESLQVQRMLRGEPSSRARRDLVLYDDLSLGDARRFTQPFAKGGPEHLDVLVTENHHIGPKGIEQARLRK